MTITKEVYPEGALGIPRLPPTTINREGVSFEKYTETIFKDAGVYMENNPVLEEKSADDTITTDQT